MGSVFVVLTQPVLGDLVHMFNRTEQVGAQDLGAISPVKPLDISVLVGLAGGGNNLATALSLSALSVSGHFLISSRPQGLVSYRSDDYSDATGHQADQTHQRVGPVDLLVQTWAEHLGGLRSAGVDLHRRQDLQESGGKTFSGSQIMGH
jgi:hypothetical protein